MTDSINAAIELLDASLDAETGDYVYYAAETARYYRVTEGDLEDLGARIGNDDDGDGYSLWCAETASEELPAGWTRGDELEE